MSTNRKRVLLIVGTRPEAIKIAPVYLELKKNADTFETILCLTGQHREMLHQALDQFGIIPDINLDLMQHGQSLIDLTSRIISSVSKVISETRPFFVIVHGDTTTAMAAAISAAYLQVKLVHVEAGLRTGDNYSPFPEEYNRKIIGQCASVHFAPTNVSKNNLIAEGISPNSIHIVGNTVIDALKITIESLVESGSIYDDSIAKLHSKLKFDLTTTRYVLVTSHRRENFGNGIENICNAIKSSSCANPDLHFVFPVHLNPEIKLPVLSLLSGCCNVHLIEPLGYRDFSILLKNCYFVLTDSGGIQEEAPSLGKPVLVMRTETERPEALSAGTVRLVSSDSSEIVMNIERLYNDEIAYKEMASAVNPYGYGDTAKKIANILKSF